MTLLLDALLSLLIPASIVIHLLLSPFTKVEESFNIQAIHDILDYGIPIPYNGTYIAAAYDHAEFPGSVPRTFTGALVLAGLSKPFIRWMTSPKGCQLLVRGLLALVNTAALWSLRNALTAAFGNAASNWYILLQTSQFHVAYYASRTLPNMYAFAMTTLALTSYIVAISGSIGYETAQKHHRRSLFLLTVAGVIFRSELAVLVFTQTSFLLLSKRASLANTIIPAGLIGVLVGLFVTIPVDSFFWQKFPLWPEWVSFYYNTLLGKSADWGTSPWYFYFTNALPRLLLNPLAYTLLMPVAVFSPASRSRVAAILVPQLAYVGLYSFLPHKEWRFILYVIPGLTAVSAVGAAWIWNRRTKSLVYYFLAVGLIGSIVASATTSSVLLVISRMNYPGGEALVRLHKLAGQQSGPVKVYADNLACQTGVTRFLEGRTEQVNGQPKWTFDKTENQTALLSPIFWEQFDYVLAEKPERCIGKWEIVDVVTAFDGIHVVRPGHDLEQEIGQEHNTPDAVLLEGKIGVLQAWNDLGEALRQKMTRGWWVTVKMAPKIKILKKQPHTGS